MRFRFVSAISFGPFQNRQLDFAPGMTVIIGPNGAGKSSWHAATYAGLCGIRRGGGLRREDASFRERHRPWDAEKWIVSAEIALDNGQHIALRYDLDGRVDCSAVDVDLGRDVSNDIIFDGTPDGSRFVGLDRRAFARTACVSQADILGVVIAPEELQDHLQRAAASADRDATASSAIQAIENYARDFVGLDRRNSTKPLRAAKDALEQAHSQVASARSSHELYLRRLVERDRLTGEAAAHERTYACAEAAFVRTEAEKLSGDLKRARAVAEEIGPEPPAQLEDDRELSNAITAAISAYESFPPAPPKGEDPASLRSELSRLPPAIEGETSPDTGIVEANRRLSEVTAAAAEHALHKPQSKAAPPPVAAAPRTPVWLYGLAAVTFAMAIVLLVVRQPGAAAAAAVAGVATLAWLVTQRLRPAAMVAAGVDISNEAEHCAWEDRAAAHGTEAERLRSILAQALEARGYEHHNGLGAICRRYLDDCAARAQNAAERSRKLDLEHRLAAAESQGQQVSEYESWKAEILANVEQLARQCSVLGDTPTQLSGLHAWQRAHAERLRALRAAIGKWEELQGVLRRRTLEELAQETSEKAREADHVCAALKPGDLDDFWRANGAPTSVSVRAALESATTARTAADREAGEVGEMARSLTSVAEAEEALQQAQVELERVQRLERTLNTTHDFLERAQETVHRSIAPVLRASLEEWLPVVTNGLYSRATVNPETLGVQVGTATGVMRDAMLLSHGTAEQVYLMLRIAMVDHLTKASAESCPLILDDITAHCDDVRAVAIMDLLHSMSRDRQIIVFSQQRSILNWASEHLDPARDRLEQLDASLIAT